MMLAYEEQGIAHHRFLASIRRPVIVTLHFDRWKAIMMREANRSCARRNKKSGNERFRRLEIRMTSSSSLAALTCRKEISKWSMSQTSRR